MRRPVRLLALAWSALLAGAASAAPSAALVTAREQIADAKISAVTFRTMDAFFPTENVEAGKAARLPVKLATHPGPVTMGDASLAFDDALVRNYTNALLVIRDGKIEDERYLNGASASDRFMSWSVAKSIVSILMGIAVDRGLIDIRDPVEKYLPDLKGTAYEGATVEQLLLMRDGTSYTEDASDGQSTLELIRARAMHRNEMRFADIADLGLTRVVPPGERFHYSTLTSTILGRVVESATGKTLAQFTEEALWKPAGMEAPAYWLLDGDLPEGRALGGGGFNATLRDYGRIGLLMLNEGKATNGRRIVSKEWVRASTRYPGTQPVIPQAPRGYQFQWWTMLGTERFDAIGVHGQFVSIDPATNTVIVKLSFWPERGGKQYNLDTLALLEALRNGPR